MLYRAVIGKETIEIEVRDGALVRVGDRDTLLGVPLSEWTINPLPKGHLLIGGGKVLELVADHRGAFVSAGSLRAQVALSSAQDISRADDGGGEQNAYELRAPMPGKIVKVQVTRDDKLTEGDLVIVIEAMKMQNELRSQGVLCVEKVLVSEGENVEAGALLVSFVEEDSASDA